VHGETYGDAYQEGLQDYLESLSAEGAGENPTFLEKCARLEALGIENARQATDRQNTRWRKEIVANCEHCWQPVSMVFERELWRDGRLVIRQPDLNYGRVYLVCLKCRSYTYAEVGWAGFTSARPTIWKGSSRKAKGRRGMGHNTLSYEDAPEEVFRKEIEVAARQPWNEGLPPGQVRVQMPGGDMGTFDTLAQPDPGQTFVGRLRITPEQAANGRAGWTKRRLLARLAPGRYLLDVGTPWEREEAWPDEDVACIGVLVEVTRIFSSQLALYVLGLSAGGGR